MVILITTKKGKEKRGMGISVNSQITVGNADLETLPFRYIWIWIWNLEGVT